jgi:hypothetical protein
MDKEGRALRPKSVIQAERLFLLSLLLLFVGAALDWAALVAIGGLGLAIGIPAAFVGAWLLMILFATRGGSRVARILLAIVTLVSVASMLWQVGSAQVAFGAASIVNLFQTLAMVIATVLLFRPDAAAWFTRSHPEWEEDA